MYISTKNLYLCLLQKIDSREYDRFKREYVTVFDDKCFFVFAKKDIWSTGFIDIFTKTEYKPFNSILSSTGEYVIREFRPVLTKKKYLKKSLLAKAIQQYNPNILGFNEKKKKRVLKDDRKK